MVKLQPLLRYCMKPIPTLIITLLLSACNSPNSSLHKAKFNSLYELSQAEFEQLVRNVEIKTKILDQYANWRGVAYRFGGTTKKGIDCSAFTQRMFSEQFGINLPRSTDKQQYTGHWVKQQNLLPGDLVFFRTGTTNRHVGIYIGNDKFVHASTSSGVTVSAINDDYWSKRYYAARRIINTY
ncbi:MAG: bifunctional murein DD-endopeptidase/murein LD-carboxypeptidase [Candidatus Phlomobacter fragariae]